jgi:type VI secretion system protein ImpJ
MSTQHVNKIVWHDGMPLSPVHLQQHNRYFEYLLDNKLSLFTQNLWGFVSLELDTDLLSIGKLGVKQASGVFPDGTIFNMPGVDDAPPNFIVPEGLTNTILYLVLNERHANVADCGDEHSTRAYRYRAITKTLTDNVADSEQTAEVTVASLACRLITEHDDMTGLIALPIAKIKEARANNQITFDKSFLIPMLDCHQADALAKFIQEVQVLLNHRAEMLAARLTDTQQAGSADIVDLMLLQLSNRYEAIFNYLSTVQPLHPQQLYFHLLEMLSEMATYTTNKRRANSMPAYDHTDLFETFKPIIKEVRHALSMVLEQNATSIVLDNRGHGLWVGQVNDKSLLETCTFVLAVYADQPLEALRMSFPAQIKIAPVEQIKDLVSKALPGIALELLPIAPRQIPYHPNFCYFSMKQNTELWKRLSQSGGVALHISGNLSGLKLELWAIKG